MQGKWFKRRLIKRRATAVGAVALAALSLAACGSSSSSSSSTSHSGGSTNVAAAQAAIAPITGHPSAFPVDLPLARRLPAGTRFVYLQCASPTCALFGQLLVPAVKTIGGTLSIINSGGTASSSQAAASSALAEKPAAVLIPATTPSLFGNSLKRLDSAGVKVVGGWVMNPQPYGINVSVGDHVNATMVGKLMADWVIVHKGANANVVFYTTPELGFSVPMQAGFAQEIAKDCSSCKLRVVPISVTTFGSTAPQSVVSDLQSHSDTNTAVFGAMDAATGLPAALKSAGLSVTTLGFAPSPGNLQDIRTGGLTAGVGFDLPVQTWTVVDAAARLLLNEPVPAQEANVPLEFLGAQQITFNPSKGWTGYPNFPQRFVKLWSAK